MQNLRILEVNVLDSSNIEIKFTHELIDSLVVYNFAVLSDTYNIPDSSVIGLTINKNIATLNILPITQMASYKLVLKSTDIHPFISKEGIAQIIEDGISNVYSFIGPNDEDNPILNGLKNFFNGNVYDLENKDTLVAKYIDSLSTNISRALYDIKQVKNENYISFSVIDEEKTRGKSGFDRLNEEGAYEIIRVGRGPTTTNITSKLTFDSFPTYPVTLQYLEGTESFTVDSVDAEGVFNINSFTFTFENKFVTKVTDITFTLLTVNPVYKYDISKYGYQILDSRYDQNYASTYYQLLDNQIRLNQDINLDPNFDSNAIFKIDVKYEYKNTGRIVDESTIECYNTLSVNLEETPAITNIFQLNYFPIVDNSAIATKNGVSFVQAESRTQHPAFVNEIPYSKSALPWVAGQFAVDYETGTVYVYGSSKNDGTGPYPPLCSYEYKHVYKEDLDYNYDSTLLDIIAIPTGNMYENNAVISFGYQDVFVEGVDYETGIHTEALSERIENRITSLNSLRVKNSNITNVFRILNETSGEIYTISRWFNDTVYFRYTNPPRILNQTQEKVSCEFIANEMLFVNTRMINTNSTIVFKIKLNNDNIFGTSENCIGSSFDTSVYFTNNIFQNEKWFDELDTEISNINRLNIGEYCINYIAGIVYLAVDNTQNNDIGFVSYKHGKYITTNKHLISVNDLYIKNASENDEIKKLSYTSFGDDWIIPETFDNANKLFLNDNEMFPYVVSNNEIGVFDNVFVPGVTNKIISLNGLYEIDDLLNNAKPVNFANNANVNDYLVTVNSISGIEHTYVQQSGSMFYVTLNKDVRYFSPNITYTFSVNNGSEIYSGVAEPGEVIKLYVNSSTVNEFVSIEYSFTINSLSRVVLNYNYGDQYIDYTYLADELIVSYEYGDNSLDFRRSKTITENDTYYVSYKVGALRDALLRNFGNLINIPELLDFDVNFDRERYRDALYAALSSFIQGPTKSALQNIGKVISHINPDITESAFDGWSLGYSLLNPSGVTTTGEFELVSAKYGNGVLIDNNQTITMPMTSNLRLEEGTFETWIVPQWDGIDCNASLTFDISKNSNQIDVTNVFLGAAENHPNTEIFTVSKNDCLGVPNMNKDGIYIYIDKESNYKFEANKWFITIVDGYNSSTSDFTFKIKSNGKFYYADAPNELNLFSGTSDLTFDITAGTPISKTVSFISDFDHYLLDFGKEKTKNRLSLFKDVSGYMNFSIFDKFGNPYIISYPIIDWKFGEQHHVAISWKMNSKNEHDEMHLFIDGAEVPNIIKYNTNQLLFKQNFRTTGSELFKTSAIKNVVGSVDLNTFSGSTIVTSSLNFNAYGINVGDTIFIYENGFDTNGYEILNVSGQQLTLNANMPFTLENCKFSINPITLLTETDIEAYSDIFVKTVTPITDVFTGTVGTNLLTAGSLDIAFPGNDLVIDGYQYTIISVDGYDVYLDDVLQDTYSSFSGNIYGESNTLYGVNALQPDYQISSDNLDNILVITNNVKQNDWIYVGTYGLVSKKVRRKYYLWSDHKENIIKTKLPTPVSLNDVNVIHEISNQVLNSDNTTVIGNSFTYQMPFEQPNTYISNKSFSLSLTGNNIDFSLPVTVVLDGYVPSHTTENINFIDYGTIESVKKFSKLLNITVSGKFIDGNNDFGSLSITESSSITVNDGYDHALVKYSYITGYGSDLSNDGYDWVRSEMTFSQNQINSTLIINSPINVAGYYKIVNISSDRHSIQIEPLNGFDLPLDYFDNGLFQIVNNVEERTGLQNGYFSFEWTGMPSEEYYLSRGNYLFDYSTYLKLSFDTVKNIFIGSDIFSNNQINAIVDQTVIYNNMLKDTKPGETIDSSEISITKNYNSIKQLKVNNSMLVLLNYDSYPFINEAKFITEYAGHNIFESNYSVNDRFEKSIDFEYNSLRINNDGILDTKKQGTIEFWFSPKYDTSNDRLDRYYFDAYSAVTEEIISSNNVTIDLNSRVSEILSVTVEGSNIDYFAGGKLDNSTNDSVIENVTSLNNSTIVVAKKIKQVLSVKAIGDLTNKNYANDATFSNSTIYLNDQLPQSIVNLQVIYKTTQPMNNQVVRLNRRLPNFNTKTIVKYIPKGMQGDRISLLKDKDGCFSFRVIASNVLHEIKVPVFYTKGSWHKVKAQYKFNKFDKFDDIRLFLDGYEYQNTSSGINLFGNVPVVSTVAFPRDGYQYSQNIKFKDKINQLVIGGDYENNLSYALIDNLRISNIYRDIYAPYGEGIDAGYTKPASAFPMTKDLYTTYLQNFNTSQSSPDFVILRNKYSGLFDFSMTIFDSFKIINDNEKVKTILEKLIRTLKPANSRAFIQYF